MGVIFKLLFLLLKKGPPEAVIIIFSTSDELRSLITDHIEKCSESTGINFVLCFWSCLLIKHHPQIIDSLFAIAIVFVCFTIFKVGLRPSKPVIAHIV